MLLNAECIKITKCLLSCDVLLMLIGSRQNSDNSIKILNLIKLNALIEPRAVIINSIKYIFCISVMQITWHAMNYWHKHYFNVLPLYQQSILT